MLSRARRHGLLAANTVKGVAKFKEPEGRIQFAMPEQEAVILDALRPDLRSLFAISINTGLRWSEQIDLEWRYVDFMTGLLIAERSKRGYFGPVRMHLIARSVLLY